MNNQTNMRSIVTLICASYCLCGMAQAFSNLPFWEKQKSIVETDWLIKQTDSKAQLFQTKKTNWFLATDWLPPLFPLNPKKRLLELTFMPITNRFINCLFKVQEFPLGARGV
ncbi:MAG: hypothetical protein WCP85_29290 [Mariniphaga sp.]